MNPPETIPGSSRHAGPYLGLVAIVFAALKFASLIPVSAFGFAGELTWFTMIVPGLGFLVPLTRFPGFVWLIAVGFLLPATIGERIGNRYQIA